MARVLVLGSSNTDMTIRLPNLPRPGETVLGGSLLSGPGGKGANQAVAVARGGGEVVFITAVGDDAFGHDSLDLYRSEGIDVSFARIVAGHPSGVALILVDGNGENMIGVAPGANSHLRPSDIAELPDALFARGGCLLVAGLEIPCDAIAAAIHLARLAAMTIVLNPAPVAGPLRESIDLGSVDFMTPNRTELGQLTGLAVDSQDEIAEALTALCALGLRGAVVTLGSEGALALFQREFRRIPSHRVEAVDTVGAGDAFSAALALALAESRPFFEAANWASAAAALAVTKPGAQSALPTRSEIDRLASA
jgi:ribokinase